MQSDHESVRALTAAVCSDGSVDVELVIPGQDETIETTIQPTPRSKKLAPPARYDLDLDSDGDEQDRVFRRMIHDVCREIEKQIAARQAEVSKRQTRKPARA